MRRLAVRVQRRVVRVNLVQVEQVRVLGVPQNVEAEASGSSRVEPSASPRLNSLNSSANPSFIRIVTNIEIIPISSVSRIFFKSAGLYHAPARSGRESQSEPPLDYMPSRIYYMTTFMTRVLENAYHLEEQAQSQYAPRIP